MPPDNIARDLGHQPTARPEPPDAIDVELNTGAVNSVNISKAAGIPASCRPALDFHLISCRRAFNNLGIAGQCPDPSPGDICRGIAFVGPPAPWRALQDLPGTAPDMDLREFVQTGRVRDGRPRISTF